MSAQEYNEAALLGALMAGENWLEAPLPKRVKCSDAEVRLCACWMDEHGDDPADWSEDVRLSYAAAVAQMRVDGAL